MLWKTIWGFLNRYSAYLLLLNKPPQIEWLKTKIYYYFSEFRSWQALFGILHAQTVAVRWQLGLELSEGFFPHRSGSWPGMTGSGISVTKQLLRVTSLGLHTTWLSQDSRTSYMTAVSPWSEVERCQSLRVWVQKLAQCHFCHILLVKAVKSPLLLQGRGHRSTSQREKCQRFCGHL